MNVLLTCVGRRSYMVEYFKEAIGHEGNVIVTNSIPNTTGMFTADRSYIVPAVNDKDYIDTLLSICIHEKVSALISLFDIDLPFLASARDRFEEVGVHIWVSAPHVIDIANDKWKTHLFLRENGIDTPHSYINVQEVVNALDTGEIQFPIVIKPRLGMGSISFFIATNKNELLFFYNYTIKKIKESYLDMLSQGIEYLVLFQEYIEGDEFGIDVLNSYDGVPLAVVTKKKLEMRSGETDSAETLQSKVLEDIGWRLGKLLKHRGNMDIDILFDKNTKRPFVLELNARFGGGYPFSHIAGADFPKAIIQMTSGVSPSRETLKSEAEVTGFKFISPRRVGRNISRSK